MSIIYCIFLYIMAIRLFVKNSNRKNYFITVSIVSVLMILTDIVYIIEVGILNYLIYSGWQILIAYALALVWIFWGSFSLRKMRFNKSFKQKDEFISTAHGKTITYSITSILMIGLCVLFIILYINKVFDWLSPILFIAPAAITIFSIILLIKNISKRNEEFVLVTWIGNAVNVYTKKIEVGKFNYKQFVGELAELYFIYNIGTVYFFGDENKIQYAYILKLNELENFNYLDLGLTKNVSVDSKVYIDLYTNKKNKAKIIIKDNIIKSIK